MNHDRNQKIREYLLEVLEGDERLEFEKSLLAEPGLRLELEKENRSLEYLRSRHPNLDRRAAPGELARRTLKRVQRERVQRLEWSRWTRVAALLALCTCAGIVMLSGLLRQRHRLERTPAPDSPVTWGPVSIEDRPVVRKLENEMSRLADTPAPPTRIEQEDSPNLEKSLLEGETLSEMPFEARDDLLAGGQAPGSFDFAGPNSIWRDRWELMRGNAQAHSAKKLAYRPAGEMLSWKLPSSHPNRSGAGPVQRLLKQRELVSPSDFLTDYGMEANPTSATDSAGTGVDVFGLPWAQNSRWLSVTGPADQGELRLRFNPAEVKEWRVVAGYRMASTQRFQLLVELRGTELLSGAPDANMPQKNPVYASPGKKEPMALAHLQFAGAEESSIAISSRAIAEASVSDRWNVAVASIGLMLAAAPGAGSGEEVVGMAKMALASSDGSQRSLEYITFLRRAMPLLQR